MELGIGPKTISEVKMVRDLTKKRKPTVLDPKCVVENFLVLDWDRSLALVLRGPAESGKTSWAAAFRISFLTVRIYALSRGCNWAVIPVNVTTLFSSEPRSLILSFVSVIVQPDCENTSTASTAAPRACSPTKPSSSTTRAPRGQARRVGYHALWQIVLFGTACPTHARTCKST